MATTAQILQRAHDTLDAARQGLTALENHDPRVRVAGVRNVIVFGRAVTNVLQNLRSTESGFDQWYAPLVAQMESDPMIKYLYKLRSEILKEGALPITSSVRVNGSITDLMTRYVPPPGAKGFFIADRLGGAGWEVET